MRVLVVDSDRVELDKTVRLVASPEQDVRGVTDPASAVAVIAKAGRDVVLVATSLLGMSSNDLVKRIRERESNTHVYVIVTASRLVPGDVRTAFLMGADDFVRKPCGRDELLARIESPARIRRWMSKVVNTTAFADYERRSALCALTAWTSADSSVCAELSDMLGLALVPRSAPDALSGVARLASVRLALVSDRAEVCLAVGVDEVSSAALAEAMFGTRDVDGGAVKDMMREFANVAAGAVKRLAATDGRILTMGVPMDASPETFRDPGAMARRDWVGTADSGEVALRFALELRPRGAKRVRASSLCEGMVVAVDLRNEAGALLVPAGTRITESQLLGLRSILGVDAPVEILEAAA